MSDDASLTPEAVSLLLELLEQAESVISAGAARMYQEEVTHLETAGLLVPHDHELVVSALDDHDDALVSVAWSERHKALTYFSPSAGIVVVPTEDVQRRRVEIARVLAAITVEWDVPDGKRPFALVDDILWEITDVRFGRRARLPVWFTRRLGDRDIQRQIIDMAKARPILTPRIIITSSRAERINDVEIVGAITVPIREVLARPEGLRIAADILDARLRGLPVVTDATPIALSPDGTQLTIRNGPIIEFRSAGQIAVIRCLIDGYPHDRRYRAAYLLKLAESDTGSLRRLFGEKKWKELEPYVKSKDGKWGLEL